MRQEDRSYFLRIKNFLLQVTKPKSESEDAKRPEFLVNVLLVATSLLLTISIVSSFVTSFLSNSVSRENNAISLFTILLFIFFFIWLHFLSRKGFFYFVSYFLLGSFFLFTTYMAYRWGIELPTALLLYTLIIVMSGILINSRFAFFITTIASITILVLNHLRIIAVIQPNLYWKTEIWKISDIIMASVIFFFIATVSWLSNRETEKSLARARRSEAELKKERDSLEVTVEKRTKELREAELEKMEQLYRFAEFGRLSSGLFHDLVNPLNALSLNMERIKIQEDAGTLDTRKYLANALSAAKKMEDFISAVRKQISKQENRMLFSLSDEIKQAVEVLSYKARKAKIVIFVSSPEEIKTFGDAIKFNQIVSNLVSNAIDSYGEENKTADEKHRKVKVSLFEKKGVIYFTVKDSGSGIGKEKLGKIFESFFTTKKGDNMGLGLSLVKRIVEKDFSGTIEVKSEKNKGTKFIIKFPKAEK